MSHRPLVHSQSMVHRHLSARFISLLVGAHGVFILVVALLEQVSTHHGLHIGDDIFVDVPLLIGLSIIYISSLLNRRKYTAWLVTLAAYVFYLGYGLQPLLSAVMNDRLPSLVIIRSLILPLAVIGLLIRYKEEFVVRSDQQGFRAASRLSLLIVLAALVYGTSGFVLLDQSDFHQEISIGAALHYTLDQFDLTTDPLSPATARAHVFVDSLSFVSVTALLYATIALFQPLRLRLGDQSVSRQRLRSLLDNYGAPSEDYFKLWPHDKQYFFDSTNASAVAYHVWRGVAVCLGDPVGNKKQFSRLLNQFSEQCYRNDWLPALVHIQATHRRLYQKQGFTLQKLGQEAVVDIANFQQTVAPGKYFRQINNRFIKQGFSTELLQPPHHSAVINRLQTVSHEWLQRGGHVERGFAMGYYATDYLQACSVMVVRDAAGTIQAFLNQLPASFDSVEATYDLLRQADDCPGNITDFLMIHFITELQAAGYQRLNMGLCPLTGLDDATDESGGLIHSALRFTYANGDRLYSFSGLYRFKAKYQPEWRDRFVAYKGGLRGFTRTTTAMMRIMRVKQRPSN